MELVMEFCEYSSGIQPLRSSWMAASPLSRPGIGVISKS
jgi:hypothetical protein